ncbi:hypothetical protein [Limnoglobus roseus]|uniref:Uncharacterized protein n=1 Tax=Limnoglobus roseus TaxID=2598579 RepID=A0A5C1AE04_9BACT|nr:hypothetical protein [Limnoglobus roseus]QEL15308.1 hypothetical protein PX52LOC_02223 [Limnoglobus roseus]
MGLFISYLATQALFTAGIFWLGRRLSRYLNPKSPIDQKRGRVVTVWVTTLYGVGAVVGGLLGFGDHQAMSETGTGLAGMGLMAGVVIGNIHAVLTIRPEPVAPSER